MYLTVNAGGVDGDGNVEWVNMDLDEEEESDEDDQMGFVHKQPLVATGMAATLALLKGTGTSLDPLIDNTELPIVLFILSFSTIISVYRRTRKDRRTSGSIKGRKDKRSVFQGRWSKAGVQR
jgi:hypothetical protein